MNAFPYIGAEWDHAPGAVRILARASEKRPAHQRSLMRERYEDDHAFHLRCQREGYGMWLRTGMGPQVIVIECHYTDPNDDHIFNDELQNTKHTLRHHVNAENVDVALAAIRSLNRLNGAVPADTPW
ncbi:MAG: hypothetical protein ABL916_16255 [Burkholderiaceae bacterium]